MEQVSGRPRASKVKGRLAACPQLAGLPVYHRHTSCITKLWDLCRPNDNNTTQGKSWSQKSLVFLGLHHMDWLTASLLIFFQFTHFSLRLSSMKSWQELLLQEITPAPGCLMESPTRSEFRVYTLLLRTFGEIFEARKRKVIAPQTKSQAGKDCVLPWRWYWSSRYMWTFLPRSVCFSVTYRSMAGGGTSGDLQSSLCTVDSRQQTADYSLEWKWRINLPRDILFCILK